MGLDDSQIKYIDFYSLESYKGEKLILPINFMIMPNILGVDMLNISDDIIPVFLGLTLTQTDINEKQKVFLKKWQPIGCRDEYTRNALNSMGIDAYIGGCIATTIEPGKVTKNRDKVIFVDVPKGVEKYIPEEKYNDIIIMEHEYVVTYEQVCNDCSYKRKALEQIEFYDKNARMIVTSRFHGAVIGLALGIPVILVAENNFYKFSWLSKLLTFYDSTSFDRIDWNPKSVDVSLLKSNMVEVAINRIKYAYSMNVPAVELDTMLENPLRDDSLALRYASSAIEYITTNWNKDDDIIYGLWGVNDNAEEIYQYINKNYKNSKLIKVYDGLRTVQFHEYVSEKPDEGNIPDDCFLFVTSNTAHKVAKELFERIGKENFFLCKLDFIRK